MKLKPQFFAVLLIALAALSAAAVEPVASSTDDVLIVGTVKDVKTVQPVEFTRRSKSTTKLSRTFGILSIAVERRFKGQCAETIDAAIFSQYQNYKGLIGQHLLIGLQTKDKDGHFFLRPYMKFTAKDDPSVYLTDQLSVPYIASETSSWFALKTTQFDQNLTPDLQLCDLLVHNAWEDVGFAHMLTNIGGSYRRAVGMKEKEAKSYESWRTLITSRFASDSKWRTKPERGAYLGMLLVWNDATVLEECKTEIRKDPDCTLFGGAFPAINDDELRLEVVKRAKPNVAQPLFVARGSAMWDKALLQIGLERLGEDEQFDQAIMAATAKVTGDQTIMPRTDERTGKVSPADLGVSRDKTRAAIQRFLKG